MTLTTSSILKKLLILFTIFAGLYFAKSFLMPLMIAITLATLFLPFCNWMEEKKVPKGLAAFLCLLVLILAIGSVAAVLTWQISELSNDIDQIKQKFIEIGERAQEYIFDHVGISAEKQTQLLRDQKSFFTKSITEIAGTLTSAFSFFILTLVYVAFLLYYRNHIKHFLLKLSPPSQREEMDKVLYRVAKVSQQYLLGLSKMIACLWIMYGIGFISLGIKNALFFAFLCGLLEIVPFIGNITGTSITVLVATVQGASSSMLIGIICTYGIIQFIQGWVLEPLIVGSEVKINPLFTIIALVIGELIWGIPGIFLAIPLIAMLKIVCDHFEILKPYGFLMGESETKKNEPGLIQKIINRNKKKFR